MIRNIWSIARGTIKEAAKRKAILVTLLISLLFIIGIGILTQRMMRSGGDSINMAATGDILGTTRTLSFFGAILTLFITMNAIPLEMERRTVYNLLSKPLERYQFILGKFLGCFLLIGLNLLLMAVIGFWFILRQSPDYAMDIVQSFGVLYVRLSALCGLVILFTTFMPATGGSLIAYCVYVLGNWPGAFQQAAQAEELNGMIRMAARILYPVIGLLTPRINKLNYDTPLMQSPDQLQAALMVVGYTAVCLLLSTIIFGRKEL